MPEKYRNILNADKSFDELMSKKVDVDSEDFKLPVSDEILTYINVIFRSDERIQLLTEFVKHPELNKAFELITKKFNTSNLVRYANYFKEPPFGKHGFQSLSLSTKVTIKDLENYWKQIMIEPSKPVADGSEDRSFELRERTKRLISEGGVSVKDAAEILSEHMMSNLRGQHSTIFYSYRLKGENRYIHDDPFKARVVLSLSADGTPNFSANLMSGKTVVKESGSTSFDGILSFLAEIVLDPLPQPYIKEEEEWCKKIDSKASQLVQTQMRAKGIQLSLRSFTSIYLKGLDSQILALIELAELEEDKHSRVTTSISNVQTSVDGLDVRMGRWEGYLESIEKKIDILSEDKS